VLSSKILVVVIIFNLLHVAALLVLSEFSDSTNELIPKKLDFPSDCVPESAISRTSGMSRPTKYKFMRFLVIYLHHFATTRQCLITLSFAVHPDHLDDTNEF
jgi:hypothetical protein